MPLCEALPVQEFIYIYIYIWPLFRALLPVQETNDPYPVLGHDVLRFFAFFSRGRRQGALALKSGQGPPGRGIAERRFSPLRRREGPPPLPQATPPAKNCPVLRCFVLFPFFPIFRILWLKMGQHGPT